MFVTPGAVVNKDGDGFAGITDPATFNFSTQPPNSPPSVTDSVVVLGVGQTASHFFSATDPDGDALTFA